MQCQPITVKKLTLTLFGLAILLLQPARSYSQNIEPQAEDTTSSTLAKLYNDVELLKRIKISGYIQFQGMFSDTTNLGTTATSPEDMKFMVRRSRLKLTYEKGLGMAVFQTDFSEKGIRVVDIYAKITDPWINWVSFIGGIYNRNFGYEVPYSSNLRETPERFRLEPLLFPNERDLGAGLIIQGPKSGNWHWLKAEASIVTGVGSPDAGKAAVDFDNKKDFIGRLSINKDFRDETIHLGLGTSYYAGGFVYNNDTAYVSATDANGAKGFRVDNVSPEGYSDRTYFGADMQLSYIWKPGATTFRAEYISGSQPAYADNTKSSADLPTKFVYTRNFSTYHFYLIQNLTKYKLQLVFKYDHADPNSDVKGDELGKSVSTGVKTNATDIQYTIYSTGINFLFTENLKLMVFHDFVKNETSSNLSNYGQDLNDDLTTIRVQYKF